MGNPVDLLEGDFTLGVVPTSNGNAPAVVPDTKTTPTTTAPVIPPVATPTNTTPKFRRVIKGQNGAGDQVFEADTAEALLDKLTTAQENATTKIRELSASKPRARKYVSLDRTADVPQPQRIPNPTQEDVMLFQANPMQFLQSFANIANRVIEIDHANKSEAAQAKAARDFCRTHADDYFPCEENWDAIEGYLTSQGAPINANNLEAAFIHLSETDGLPVLPTDEEVPPVASAPRIETPAPVPAAPVTPPTVRTAMFESGSPAPVTTENKSDLSQIANDISKMPLDEARSYLQRLMHSQRTA